MKKTVHTLKSIGGYFELELPELKEYYVNGIRLNTGRNALEYILRSNQYKNVYLPYYSCKVLLEPLVKLGISYEFYNIDKNLNPIFDYSKLQSRDAFLYINYFGICNQEIKRLANVVTNLIIDHSQAFFTKPIKGIDTFYSPRKFFGIPDGAYLFTNKSLHIKLPQDVSINRFEYLLGRIEKGAEEYHSSFVKINQSLQNQSIKQMSSLTHRLLQSIDYKMVKQKRIENFRTLHNAFGEINQLNFKLDVHAVPMLYPLLIENGEKTKKYLIQHKIYVPTYWPEVDILVSGDSVEYDLVKNLVCLPIDQRYSKRSMDKIINYFQI